MSKSLLSSSVLARKKNLCARPLKVLSQKPEKSIFKKMNESIDQLEKEVSYIDFIVKEIEDITKNS